MNIACGGNKADYMLASESFCNCVLECCRHSVNVQWHLKAEPRSFSNKDCSKDLYLVDLLANHISRFNFTQIIWLLAATDWRYHWPIRLACAVMQSVWKENAFDIETMDCLIQFRFQQMLEINWFLMPLTEDLLLDLACYYDKLLIVLPCHETLQINYSEMWHFMVYSQTLCCIELIMTFHVWNHHVSNMIFKHNLAMDNVVFTYDTDKL